jgi:hypothetical protein
MRGDAVDARQHVDWGYRFSLRETPRLWITHGVSGSGKTTLSEAVVQRHHAIRLRSDVERKRIFGRSAIYHRPACNEEPFDAGDGNNAPSDKTMLYTKEANDRTYQRLSQLARRVLLSGHSVIVDATFLRRADRQRFYDLADQSGVAISVLDCHSDLQTLRQRVADRMASRTDASDADLAVLDRQLAEREPLTETERGLVVEIPDLIQVAQSL